MNGYHYTESGLDEVIIEGLTVVTDHAGEETVMIPEIGNLHKVISEGIVTLNVPMSGKELRFLRTEMGMTQGELAETLKVILLTVSRWEREEYPIQGAAELLIRLLAVKELNLDVEMDVDAMSKKVTMAPRTQPLRINGSDPANYQLAAA